jgi:hypothetical protein
MKYLAAILLFTACTSEPDLVDQITQDLEPTRPSYAAPDGEPTIDQLVALYCPGVVYAAGVPTYKGLTGTYARLGLSANGEPLRVKLAAQKDDPDAYGTFSGTWTGNDGLPVVYAGRFAALPDNPAIGAAIAFDLDAEEGFDEVYFVLGIRRSLGLVRGLCLAGAERPFLLSRTWF